MPYRVGDRDSWVNVAQRFDVTVRNLIYANFGTLTPSEVNWYLRHYVGCKRSTRDGKNWMFSASAEPGIIQIPPSTIIEMDEVVITGRAPSPFYVVATRPEDWSPDPESPYPASAVEVVSRQPWRHANLSVGSVRVRSRTEWGAAEPTWVGEVVYYNTVSFPLERTYTNIVVHHTNNNDSIRENERRQMSRGFAALGYHFFIDSTGSVFEGRPLEVMGSHAGTGRTRGPLADPDWGSIGIVLQGDFHHADDFFSHDNVTETQLNTLRSLISALRSRFTNITNLLMHKEVIRGGSATVCPGDSLHDHIVGMRTELGLPGP